ncbi:LysM peptidoglycan-binding domain-containing protein [Bacteroidota bacterium]
MIRRIPGTILFIVSILLSSVAGLAQETEYQVHRSEDKIILEGKVYYIHIVREKETLYGISKAYNVTEKVIASENPDVFAGLRPDMVLKIPAEPVVDESVDIRDTEEFIYHVIKAGETLYFLSRKYGIDVVEIEKANPEVTISDLQINQVIKIPRRKTPAKEKDFPADSFVYHYVNKGETLYSLSVKYDVSIEEIKEINPELRWGELKSDEYIKIPRRTDQVLASEDPDSLMLDSMAVVGLKGWMDTVPEAADSLGVPFWSTLRIRRIRPEPISGSIKVAMMLPLYLHWDEVVDTLQIIEGEEDQTILEEEKEEEDIVNPRIVGYLEFYEGALLAIDSLRKQGHSVTLYTYDTERDRGRTREILRKPEMQEMDLIIGPANYWNLEIVAEFARRYEIPMVSPFSSRKEIVNYNPWVFQTTPTYDVEFKAWADYLSDYYNKTMILVHNGDSNEYYRIQYLKNELFRRISEKADLEDLVFKEVIMNDSVNVDIANVLNSEQENLVIVPSDNEAYVSNVVSPLFYQLNEYDIHVSGMPQWNRFRNIDLIYFHNLNICYYTSFYMDFEKPEMLQFIDKFHSIYRTEPYRIMPRGYNLSIYGYDLMYTFVSALGEYGDNLIYFGEEIESNPILGPYRFRRISDFGGHVNTYIGMVKFYPDLSIEHIELDTRPTQKYRYRRQKNHGRD